MSMDDDANCVHVWRLIAGASTSWGSYGDYTCRRCDALMMVPPGGAHPPPIAVQLAWIRRARDAA